MCKIRRLSEFQKFIYLGKIKLPWHTIYVIKTPNRLAKPLVLLAKLDLKFIVCQKNHFLLDFISFKHCPDILHRSPADSYKFVSSHIGLGIYYRVPKFIVFGVRVSKRWSNPILKSGSVTKKEIFWICQYWTKAGAG